MQIADHEMTRPTDRLRSTVDGSASEVDDKDVVFHMCLLIASCSGWNIPRVVFYKADVIPLIECAVSTACVKGGSCDSFRNDVAQISIGFLKALAMAS